MGALYWAQDTLRRLSNDIANAEAHTLDGLIIKARAMEAAGARIEGGIGNLGYQAPLLVAAVLSVLGSVAE